MPWFTGQSGCGCCGTDGGGGGDTGTTCADCSSGFAPTYFNVTISGMATASGYDAACDGWCQTLDGTYQIPNTSNCVWSECFDLTDSPFVSSGGGFNLCQVGGPGLLGTIVFKSVRISVAFDTFYNDVYVEFGFNVNFDTCVGTPYSQAIYYAPMGSSTPYDCETVLQPVTTLTKDITGQGIAANFCSDSAATVTLQGVYT